MAIHRVIINYQRFQLITYTWCKYVISTICNNSSSLTKHYQRLFNAIQTRTNLNDTSMQVSASFSETHWCILMPIRCGIFAYFFSFTKVYRWFIPFDFCDTNFDVCVRFLSDSWWISKLSICLIVFLWHDGV